MAFEDQDDESPLFIDGKSWYEVLGVDERATREEIARAYKELSRVYHPQSTFYDEIIPAPPSRNSRSKFELVTRAYEHLINDNARVKYDHRLFTNRNGETPKEEQPPFEHNTIMLNTGEIIRARLKARPSPQGFFIFVGILFVVCLGICVVVLKNL